MFPLPLDKFGNWLKSKINIRPELVAIATLVGLSDENITGANGFAFLDSDSKCFPFLPRVTKDSIVVQKP